MYYMQYYMRVPHIICFVPLDMKHWVNFKIVVLHIRIHLEDARDSLFIYLFILTTVTIVQVFL